MSAPKKALLVVGAKSKKSSRKVLIYEKNIINTRIIF